jgi:hypothetical protein
MVGDSRSEQCRIETVPTSSEMTLGRHCPQPRVDADEKQPGARSDQVGHGAITKRLKLAARKSHSQHLTAGDWPSAACCSSVLRVRRVAGRVGEGSVN